LKLLGDRIVRYAILELESVIALMTWHTHMKPSLLHQFLLAIPIAFLEVCSIANRAERL
jgi:hypothetical protein